jgi:hypothetical protein
LRDPKTDFDDVEDPMDSEGEEDDDTKFAEEAQKSKTLLPLAKIGSRESY